MLLITPKHLPMFIFLELYPQSIGVKKRVWLLLQPHTSKNGPYQLITGLASVTTKNKW